MLQIIKAVMRDPLDMTQMFLIFANQTEDDIFLRNELDLLCRDEKQRFHLWYTLDRPNSDWKYGVGYVNAQMCIDHLPPASSDSMILLCGPPNMVKHACEPALLQLGFTSSDYYVF